MVECCWCDCITVTSSVFFSFPFRFFHLSGDAALNRLFHTPLTYCTADAEGALRKEHSLRKWKTDMAADEFNKNRLTWTPNHEFESSQSYSMMSLLCIRCHISVPANTNAMLSFREAVMSSVHGNSNLQTHTHLPPHTHSFLLQSLL